MIQVIDAILAAQKRGEARGLTSVCSAHPFVLQETLKMSAQYGQPALIEATCNQVNQYGGYTGMKPDDFAAFVRRLALENDFPFENIVLGGDHLGPNPWQSLPNEEAMDRAEALVRSYVEAGFTKIHVDCSMKLADDPPGPLDVVTSAARAARLARAAEESKTQELRYVIGTEVPVPGGAHDHHERVQVTSNEDALQTLRVTQDAFQKEGLVSSWDSVIALVVYPGVEFGDDFVLPYERTAVAGLSSLIEDFPLVYEAHSTDYQAPQSLRQMVEDHFGILKVGPGLTFAYREAVFALSMIEDELVPVERRSNLIGEIEAEMLLDTVHWQKYYTGTAEEQAIKRRYSLSDRVRYYWVRPKIQAAIDKLFLNLQGTIIPMGLASQFTGRAAHRLQKQETPITPHHLIAAAVDAVLEDYLEACTPT